MRRGGALRVGLRALVALTSLVVFCGSWFAWASYRGFTSRVTHIDAILPVEPAGSTSASGSGAVAVAAAGSTVAENILLVGDDHRPANASPALLQQLSTGQDGGGLNTDTMMVMHIPAGGGRATVISFPRDSWVSIPGYGMNKLNSAFQYGTQNGGGDTGGARLLIKVIESMTGLHIDHFVRVSMVGFYQIAQVLGPIKVCLNEPAKDSYSGTNLPSGVSYLDPSQALSFVRQRHNLPRGDLDREIRQQYFLAAALAKVESAGTLLNPFKLESLLNAVAGSLETDPGLDLLQFAQQFSDLGSGNITYATIPITGTPTITVNGNQVSIVAVDWAALPSFVAGIVGPPSAYATATPAAPGDVTVQVRNGGTIDGAATTATAALSALGFRTLTPGSTDPAANTVIDYPPGQEAAAKAVAAHLPGAAVHATPGTASIVVILGADGLTVTSAANTPPSTAPTAAGARNFTAADCVN